MLQIIRGKLVIFLITLCLFVVYLGFDNNSNSDIVFYGHKTPKSVEIYLSEKNIFPQEPVEDRVKPFFIIFADDKRIVLACAENSENLDSELKYNLSLFFTLSENKLLKRTVQVECSVEKIYENENSKNIKCIALKYENLKEEDSRFLYERITGKILGE